MKPLSFFVKRIIQRRTVLLLVLLLMTLATFLTVFLVQKRQELRKEAAIFPDLQLVMQGQNLIKK